jgi:2-oxo-4-hydroxy-4-carboxy-5-ureidoimidazoline decarboxylase
LDNSNDDTPLAHRPADLSLVAFLKIYGAVYEKSPWIAEAAFQRRDGLDTTGDLHAAMKEAVAKGGKDKQLALIRAHPDLACGPAVQMTSHSVSEQKGAGLNTCTPAEMAEFQRLNTAYRAKFGFPFIIAVKGLDKHQILEEFKRRMNNAQEEEFNTALQQIHRIALFRLKALG